MTHTDDRVATPSQEGRGRDAGSPTDIPAAGWKDIAVRVKDDVTQKNTSLLAAGVAFYGFISLIPALAAAISIYGMVVDPQDAADRIERSLRVLPTEARELMSQQVESITSSSSSALSITAAVSIALALWAASSGMANLMKAVNQAYDELHTRKFFKQRGMALALTLGGIVLAGLALTALAVVPAIASDWPTPLDVVMTVVGWIVAAGLFLAGLAVLYRYAPERDDPEWTWVSPGAVLALVLWLLATLGLRFYATNFGSYNETYGALAGVVLLLLWLFVSAFAVLLAAEVNGQMEHQTVIDTTQGPDEPMGERGAEVADTVGRSS